MKQMFEPYYSEQVLKKLLKTAPREKAFEWIFGLGGTDDG